MYQDITQPLRIAVVSDTHGFLDPRIAEVVASCDIAVHAGDIIGKHVLDSLKPRTGHIVAVRGNNDIKAVWPEHDHAALLAIPHEDSLDLPGGQLVVLHGHRHWPYENLHPRLRGEFSHARAIIYGHSHNAVFDDDEKPWVINPGASGRTNLKDGGPSCAVLEISEKKWSGKIVQFSTEVEYSSNT